MINPLQLILHLDKILFSLVQQYGAWTYPLVFLIIFLETGIVIFPFLPGDSLLFTAGAIAAIGSLNIYLLLILIIGAAVIGDSLNYYIGYLAGPKIFSKNIPFLNKEQLIKTEKFYEKYGNKTIFLARFIPIARTFAPFVAGIGKMHYGRFLFYNIVGAVVWAGFFTLGGYFFGNMPFVKENFSIFIICIILLSFIPLGIEYIKHHAEKKRNAKATKAA